MHSMAEQAGRRPPRTRQAGLTLMELVVAVGVLAIIMLGVGTIVSATNDLASASQAQMRSTQAATAITETLRTDLQKASQNGFLCIATDSGSRPRLVLTAAGTTYSVTGPASGSGALVAVGQVANGADGSLYTLWRPGWVLSQTGTDADVWNTDFVVLQSATRSSMDSIVTSVLGLPSPSPSVPADSLSEIRMLWQVLADRCTNLTISWTDGTTDGSKNLQWYNKDNAKTSWSGKTIADNTTEYSSSGRYRALWTNHNQSNWPKAIKINFTLTDPTAPADYQTLSYEVIAPVGAD